MTVASEPAGHGSPAAGDGLTRLQETPVWGDLARHDQQAAQAGVNQESDSWHDRSGGGRQEELTEAAAEFEDVAIAYRAAGFPELAADAEQRAAIAREDHAAVTAGIDYRDLDGHFGPQSAATPELAAAHWPCGYPETHAGRLAQAERETRDPEAGQ